MCTTTADAHIDVHHLRGCAPVAARGGRDSVGVEESRRIKPRSGDDDNDGVEVHAPERREAAADRRARARPTTAAPAAVLAVVVVLATALAGPWTMRHRHVPPLPLPSFDIPTEDAGGGSGGGEQQAPEPPPEWLVVGVRVLLALVAIALLMLIGRAVARRLPTWWHAVAGSDEDGGPVDTAGGVDPGLDAGAVLVLEEAVAEADRALLAAQDPGDAVVAAWMALEEAAAGIGLDRDPAQTTSEFALALLDRTSADPGAARRLLALYHAARFSEHRVSDGDVAGARAALGVLRNALRDRGAR